MPYHIAIYFSQFKSNYVPLIFLGEVQFFLDNTTLLGAESFQCQLPPPPFIPSSVVIYEKQRTRALHPLKISCQLYLNGSITTEYLFQYSLNPPLYANVQDYFDQAVTRAAFQRTRTDYYYEDSNLVHYQTKLCIGILRFEISTTGSIAYFEKIQRTLLTDQFHDSQVIIPLQTEEVKLAILNRGIRLKNGYLDSELAEQMLDVVKGSPIDSFEPGFIQKKYDEIDGYDSFFKPLDKFLHKNPAYTYTDLVPNVNYLRTLGEEKGLLEKLHGLVLYVGNKTGAFNNELSDVSQLQLLDLVKYGVMDTVNTNINAAEVLVRWGMNLQDFFQDDQMSSFGHAKNLFTPQILWDSFALQNALFNTKFLRKPVEAILFNPNVASKLKGLKDMGIYFLTKASILGLADRFGTNLFDSVFRTTGTQLAELNKEYPSINEFAHQTYESSYIQHLVKAMGYTSVAAVLYKLKNLGIMNANYHRTFNELARNTFVHNYGPGILNSAIEFYNAPTRDFSPGLLPIDIALHGAGFNANRMSTYDVYDYGNFKKYLTRIVMGKSGEAYGDKSVYTLTVQDLLKELSK